MTLSKQTCVAFKNVRNKEQEWKKTRPLATKKTNWSRNVVYVENQSPTSEICFFVFVFRFECFLGSFGVLVVQSVSVSALCWFCFFIIRESKTVRVSNE